MNIIAGISAAGALLREASEFVGALKKPRTDQAEFAQMLREQVAHQRMSQPLDDRPLQAEFFARRVMRLLDADGDGNLTLEESALQREIFEKMDLDRDGRLQLTEIRNHMLQNSGVGASNA